jgi:hypothetical protein
MPVNLTLNAIIITGMTLATDHRSIEQTNRYRQRMTARCELSDTEIARQFVSFGGESSSSGLQMGDVL